MQISPTNNPNSQKSNPKTSKIPLPKLQKGHKKYKIQPNKLLISHKTKSHKIFSFHIPLTKFRLLAHCSLLPQE